MVDMIIGLTWDEDLEEGYAIGAYDFDNGPCPNRRYFGCSQEEAEQKYVAEFGLEHRTINRIDCVM